MFKEMRRKEKGIDSDHSARILENGLYGILSTAGENGYAYGVPLNYAYLEGNIYFHCAAEGYKLDNIKYNDKVSFCVIGKTELLPEKFDCRYESVIAFGRASEVGDEEKADALTAIIKKYSASFIDKGLEYIRRDSHKTKVIKISIEYLTGKEGK